MKEVSRSDKKYKEIEKFKDYELIQCVAYEMAIRNPEIKALVAKRGQVDILSAFDEKWVEKLNTVDSSEKAKKLLLEYVKAHPEQLGKLSLEDKINDEIKQKSFFPVESLKSTKVNTSLNNPYFLEYVSNSSQRTQAEKSKVIDSHSIGSVFNDDGTAKTIAGGKIKYAELFPRFSRPIPVIPTEASKEIDLVINLALPEEELASYIQEIKKVYTKSNGAAFQAATPLSTASEIDKEIFSIRIKVKKKGSKTNLEMPEKSQQEVYADLLFLYDVFCNSNIQKQGEKIQYFQNEMIDYYAKKVITHHGLKDIDEVSDYIGTPRDQTVREYVKVMKSYINDYGYKKLLV